MYRNPLAAPVFSSEPCKNCGYKHRKDLCAAKRQSCNFCSISGHFAKVCRKRLSKQSVSKDRKADHVDEAPTDSLNILNICSIEIQQTPHRKRPKRWYVSLQLYNTKVRFKVDTGSECNTLIEIDFNKISPKPEMISAGNIALRPYISNKLIRPVSKVIIPYNASLKIEYYVVSSYDKVHLTTWYYLLAYKKKKQENIEVQVVLTMAYSLKH